MRRDSHTAPDEALCRVCRSGEECGELYYPCQCKGSIRFVHEECLVKWLRVSRKRHCELCLTEFEFQSVYRQGAPERLTSLHVLFGSLRIGFANLPDLSRYLKVGLLWLVVFPLLTARVNSLFFLRSKANLMPILTDWSFETVSRDCVRGVFLAGWIVCVFLALMVVHDYSTHSNLYSNRRQDRIHRHLRRNETIQGHWTAELGNDEAANGNMRQRRQLGDIADRVVETAVAVAADANDFVDDLQAAGESHRLLEFGNRFLRERVASALHMDNAHEVQDGLNSSSETGSELEFEAEDMPEEDLLEEEEEEEEEEDEEEEGVQARRIEDEMAWEVLVGLRGGLQKGFYTMILATVANTLFLFVFQLVPFSIGRLVLLALRKFAPRGSSSNPFRQTLMTMGATALENYDLYTLSMGYATFISLGLCYVTLKKLKNVIHGHRPAVSTQDIVAKYLYFLFKVLLNIASMAIIIALELFLLSEVVGWIAHIGIMGCSGDFGVVFANRAEMCKSSPMTCVFIHWAVGSVVIANWSALIWAFRQVVHPYFKVRFFEGWYDASKKLQLGLFGPMIALRERQTQQRTESWKKKIEMAFSRMLAERSLFTRDSLGANNKLSRLDFSIVFDPAPIPEPEIESAPRGHSAIISQNLEESASYVSTVLLWSIPAALAFLVIPIQVVKWLTPWVFPLRIGTFREPFAEAQLPLDMFLFHSLPYAIERLNMSRFFLDTARFVARILTRPLDLDGYVLKPTDDLLSAGFVHVDNAHSDTNGFQLRKERTGMQEFPAVQSQECRIVRNLSVRSVSEPLPGALPSLPFLSKLQVSERVEVIGVLCWVKPWVDLAPILRDVSRRSWIDNAVHVFTIADTLGYCTPVYVQFGKEERLVSSEGMHVEDDTSLERTLLGIVECFIQDLDLMRQDPLALERAQIIRSYLAEYSSQPQEGSFSNVIMLVRAIREEVQDRPDLVDQFVSMLPPSFGNHWQGGSCESVLNCVRTLGKLWRDQNAPPVVAFRGAKVCDKHGRSLLLDEEVSVLVEPDSGGLAQLARICFQARRQQSSTAGQFCVLRHEPDHLLLRLRVLGVFAAFASVVASAVALVLPLLVGRNAFALLGDPLKHDVYHWGGGCFLIWFVYTLGRWFFTTAFDPDGGWRRAMGLFLYWVLLGMKWLIILVLFGILIPLLTGTLFEVVFLDPFRVGFDRTPVFLVFQDWALGLAVLKAWSRLVLLGVFGETEWVSTLEQIQFEDGYDIRLEWVMRQVAGPLLHFILVRLSVPYFVSRSFEYYFQWDAYTAEMFLRSSFPVFTAVLWIYSLIGTFEGWINAMHDVVFDAEYRVGRQLRNR